jgi:hypothetical protein
LLLNPAVQSVHPITYIGNRPASICPLDYMLEDVGRLGTVVPQRLWSPTTTADAQRYGTVPLIMPIFVIQRHRLTLGLPLNQAALRDCSALLNALAHPPYSTIKDEKTN